MPSLVTRRYRALNAEGFYKSITGTAQGDTQIVGLFANTANIISTSYTTYVQGFNSNTTAKVTGYSVSTGTLVVSNVSSTAGFDKGEAIRIRKINAKTGAIIGNSTGGIGSTNIPSNPTSRYYVYIGKPIAWANDSAPPVVNASTQNEQFDLYRDMIAMKRIQLNDVTYVIPRYNWTNNTRYVQYTDTSTTLANSMFYVITDEKNVYKCIDNNGANSTVKPTGISTLITTTADGYRWKYMYTVSDADYIKFATSSHIPVKTLTENDSSSQWAVQQAAANGAIHHIVVANSGSGYFLYSNTFSGVVNSTVFTLGSSASSVADIYANSSIFIYSGAGAGQLRKIKSYVGGTKTLTVNNAFSPIPNTSSVFMIGPTVIIRGDSGATAALRATAYVSRPMNQVAGISRITMVNEGRNYSTANVVFDAYTGSGARGTPIISPPGIHGAGGNHGPGGHGSDPVAELYGEQVIVNVRVVGTEGNTFPANNDYRTVGILRDPLLRSGTSNYANASVLDLTTRLYVTGVTGDFVADEHIRGGTSKAEGRLVYFANTNAARTQGILKLIRTTTTGTGGFFSPSETVTGLVSGKTASISSVARPAIKEYTGDILYNENIVPVQKTPGQTENIKILIKF